MQAVVACGRGGRELAALGSDFLLCSPGTAGICSERDARQDKHRKG